MARLGAILRGAFGLPVRDRAAVERVKAWARAALSAHPETAVAVSEIASPMPYRPIETILVVMEPGVPMRTCRIPKPLDAVVEHDIHNVLNG